MRAHARTHARTHAHPRTEIPARGVRWGGNPSIWQLAVIPRCHHTTRGPLAGTPHAKAGRPEVPLTMSAGGAGHWLLRAHQAEGVQRACFRAALPAVTSVFADGTARGGRRAQPASRTQVHSYTIDTPQLRPWVAYAAAAAARRVGALFPDSFLSGTRLA